MCIWCECMCIVSTIQASVVFYNICILLYATLPFLHGLLYFYYRVSSPSVISNCSSVATFTCLHSTCALLETEPYYSHSMVFPIVPLLCSQWILASSFSFVLASVNCLSDLKLYLLWSLHVRLCKPSRICPEKGLGVPLAAARLSIFSLGNRWE